MKGLLYIFAALVICCSVMAGPIDREALVRRHNIEIHATIPHSPTQVGNGRFAFGMDITGLQTFEAFNTLSEWGWQSFPIPDGKKISDYSPQIIESYGQKIPYLLKDPDEPELSKWLEANPNRANLGRIGFILLKQDGSPADYTDLTDITQTVDLWTGLVYSTFTLQRQVVNVQTCCAMDCDMISVKVESQLVTEGRIGIFIDFPYAECKSFAKEVGVYDAFDKHTTTCHPTDGCIRQCRIRHKINDLKYDVFLTFDAPSDLTRVSATAHRYTLMPKTTDRFEFKCLFCQGRPSKTEYTDAETSSAQGWYNYWTSGAAIDLCGSKDPRWFELERRIVLSQYLMRINEYGKLPPQESGLVNNGWYGRFHWEMIWWHWAHWYLWNHMEISERIRNAYDEFMPEAVKRAETEGRKGAKWPKCTGNINREWPCLPHAMLLWQQPHPIWFAEMDYRSNPDMRTLRKWRNIVIRSADYLADVVFWDEQTGKYVIGAPVVPVSENTDPLTTVNPAFELAYLGYGLRTALLWSERLNLKPERTERWRNVLNHLSPLPTDSNGYYITYQGMVDMWEKYNYEHPAITGIYGWLSGEGVDKDIFARTYYRVLKDWQMNRVWGWDYPMMAMAAARLGDREQAVELLLANSHKFGFDEHGLATTWPFPYFPANGGLLTAVAMMANGWDGALDNDAPGFPNDGSWTVRYEGFNTMQ